MAQGQWQCTAHHLTPGYATLFILSLLLEGVGREEPVGTGPGTPCDRSCPPAAGWGRRRPPPRAVFSNLCLCLFQPGSVRLGTWVCKKPWAGIVMVLRQGLAFLGTVLGFTFSCEVKITPALCSGETLFPASRWMRRPLISSRTPRLPPRIGAPLLEHYQIPWQTW